MPKIRAIEQPLAQIPSDMQHNILFFTISGLLRSLLALALCLLVEVLITLDLHSLPAFEAKSTTVSPRFPSQLSPLEPDLRVDILRTLLLPTPDRFLASFSPMQPIMPALTSATIGFPRIGPKREMKKALEDYWAGKSSQADLVAVSQATEAGAWAAQAQAGIDLIALDGTYYDQILDTISYLGLIPERFNALSGLDRYFAAARGTTSAIALDMSKYYDTNYHQIVPELNADSVPVPDWGPLLDRVRRGQAVVGAAKAVPLLVGPLTFVALSHGEFNASEMTQRLVPAYVEALNELAKLGVPEVQVYSNNLENMYSHCFLSYQLFSSILLSPLYKLCTSDQNGIGGIIILISTFYLNFLLLCSKTSRFYFPLPPLAVAFSFLSFFVTRPLADYGRHS